MALLADLFLATDDAHALQYDTAPGTFPDRLQYTLVTELQLSMLWAMVRGINWDVKSLRQFANIFQAKEGQVLICRLPATMLHDLLNLPAEQTSAVAAKWAATAEMKCQPDEARSIIEGLLVSARKAAQSGQNVYLWNCV